MDRNDLKDNGQLDILQNVTEYTSRLCQSSSVEYYIQQKMIRC